MKKQIIIIILIMLLLAGCVPKENYESSFDKLNQSITSYFRTFYVDNKNYIKKEQNILGLSTQGGIVEGYFDGEELKQMRLSLFGELGKTEDNYYFINENSIYLIKHIYEYDKSVYEEPNITKEYLEEYFIKDGKLMSFNPEMNDIIEVETENAILNQLQTAKAKILE